jgi:hypothetical protein
MKKSVNVLSKDRLTKSGKQKRAPSGNVASASPSTAVPTVPDFQDISESPFICWAEWSDQEVFSEKWNTKHVFEDPDGFIQLPRSLRGLIDAYKRPVEILADQTQLVVYAPGTANEEAFRPLKLSPSHISSGRMGVSSGSNALDHEEALQEMPELEEELDEANNDATAASVNEEPSTAFSNNALGALPSQKQSTAGSRASLSRESGNDKLSMGDTPEIYTAASRFTLANQHLLESELMRSILAGYHFIFEHAKPTGKTDEMVLWDHIYPKGKDGTPMYNASGKYMVKLFFLGAWRKITIDDRIPVDNEGKPLLICSSISNELWPLLLTKAVLKIAALR